MLPQGVITSRHNPLVARFRSAVRGDLPDLILLDGLHLIHDALDARLVIREAVVSRDARDRDEVRRLMLRLSEAGVETAHATPSVMEAVSAVHSPAPIAALAVRPSTDSSRMYAAADPLVVIAADVQDPGNLGAIVRVAEAAGATGAIVTGGSADPFGWKALRGSMGSALRLPVGAEPDVEAAIRAARRAGCAIVATVPRNGRSLYETALSGATAVLVGGEGPGLPPAIVEAADIRVTIPMQSPVESLNAAVAAALVLYEVRRQRETES